MLEPRREGLLVREDPSSDWRDRTGSIVRFDERDQGRRYAVQYDNRDEPYHYGAGRVAVLRNLRPLEIGDGVHVEVRGVVWNSITEVSIFESDCGVWWRLFYTRTSTGEMYSTIPGNQVRLVQNVASHQGAAEVLAHWRSTISQMSPDDSLRRAWDRLAFVHPESALGGYLTRSPVTESESLGTTIFPFRSNLSQQAAIDNALRYSVSIVEGPPGTGKTQTILNLLANILVSDAGIVGVVSLNNAAVDNVRDKLGEQGFGHVMADLGRHKRRETFFQTQDSRNATLGDLLCGAPHASPPLARIAAVGHRLRRLQAVERQLAERLAQLDAYRLEFGHFEAHREGTRAPDLNDLPLLRRSADRVLSYLAESELERRGPRPGLIARIRKYFRYGSTQGLDPEDSGIALGLQRAYYVKRIEELEGGVADLESELTKGTYDEVVEEHRELSLDALRSALDRRYRSAERESYSAATYKLGTKFPRFIRDYPVILSTCHSLRASLADGFLLDYLIIDEASQVDVLTAALALSCSRRLIIVGDHRQLQPVIVNERTPDIPAPEAAYDCRKQSILSSVLDLYGDQTPRTMLVEHYRCAPAIIGFCNRAFYEGHLVPYTTNGDAPPMILWRTLEGNHMRQHREGGRSNQREVDVVAQEVISHLCPDVEERDIGVIAPYRRQVDKMTEALSDLIQPSTVHKVQGREQRVMVFTTVLDETWRGQTGLRFVDDPHLINVAVSRATRTFVLVTNRAMLPRSRHIRELRDYILYQTPGEKGNDSTIISIFDLLYRDYSDRLQSLASRLRGEMKYKSEDITWTVLSDLLEEVAYRHLEAVPQVLLMNLIAGHQQLTEEQWRYIRHRASVDFVVYRRVSRRPLLAIEVDGFKFHENNVRQLERDALKDAIFARSPLRLLRLPTTGSGEQERIRRALDAVDKLA